MDVASESKLVGIILDLPVFVAPLPVKYLSLEGSVFYVKQHGNVGETQPERSE